MFVYGPFVHNANAHNADVLCAYDECAMHAHVCAVWAHIGEPLWSQLRCKMSCWMFNSMSLTCCCSWFAHDVLDACNLFLDKQVDVGDELA